MKVNRGGAREGQEGSTKWEGWEQRSGMQTERYFPSLLVAGPDQLLAWRGETLLFSGETSMESCTATAGFLLVEKKCSCTWTEQHLPWLMPALLLAQTLCLLPELWLLLSVWASACHGGHQTALSWVTPAYIIGWLTPLGKSTPSMLSAPVACPASHHCDGTSPHGIIVALHINKGLTAWRWLALSAWSSAPVGISVPSCTSTAPSSSGVRLCPSPTWLLSWLTLVSLHVCPDAHSTRHTCIYAISLREEAGNGTRACGASVASASWASVRFPLQRMWSQERQHWQE